MKKRLLLLRFITIVRHWVFVRYCTSSVPFLYNGTRNLVFKIHFPNWKIGLIQNLPATAGLDKLLFQRQEFQKLSVLWTEFRFEQLSNPSTTLGWDKPEERFWCYGNFYPFLVRDKKIGRNNKKYRYSPIKKIFKGIFQEHNSTFWNKIPLKF